MQAGIVLNSSMRATCLGLVVGLVAACSSPVQKVPGDAAVQAPAAWRTEFAPESAIELESAWWQNFSDATLTGLVTRSLASNLDIRTAETRVAQFEALLSLSQAQRWPNVTVGTTRMKERSINPANGAPQQQTATESSLVVSYDADLFGRLAESRRAATASLRATRAAAANVHLTIAASTARSFIGLLAADAQLQILRETMTARSESLRIIRRRASVGYASRLDLSQAEADYRATEQLIPPAEQAVRRLEEQLNVLVGVNPSGVSRNDSTIYSLSVPAVPAALPSSLLRRRPDIIEGEEQLVAADHTLDAARAAFLPNLQLSADLGSVTSNLLRNDPVGIFSVGASLLAPIFDAGRLKAQADVAASKRDEAAYAYRKLAISAFAEVEDALSATRQTGKQWLSLEAQRNESVQTLRLATDRYRAGYAAFLEQLDAQRSLLSAELQLVQVRSDQLIAYVSLYQAMGGGWDPSSLQATNAPHAARIDARR